MSSLPSERAAIVGVIDPDAWAADDATARTTAWIDMGIFAACMAVVMSGTMPGGTGIQAEFEQALDAAGTGAKAVDGKAITALAAATDDDSQAIINIRHDELDMDNSYRFVRLAVTVTDAADPDAAIVDMAATVLGFDARYGPGSDFDLASVKEIVQ